MSQGAPPGQRLGGWARLHNVWCAGLFVATFLLIAPAAMLASVRPGWHQGAFWAYHVWGILFFRLAGISVRVEHRAKLPRRPCIFCPNHASYIDIPMLVYALSHYFVFVGKSSLAKVPLFGYIFKRVHIPVDRDSLRSRYAVMKKSVAALKQGKSIVIFPEGGFSDQPPQLAPFKEGAFRLAIEAQVPLVPVTLPFNWQLLPDRQPLRLHNRPAKVIFHPPIYTEGLTVADVPALQQQVEAVIRHELRQHSQG
jgi:1-acyl-sn-glycerol-3-phosphate acyltransferase